MLESEFARRVIKRLMRDFPGAVILKTDPTYIQGFPDRLILYGDRWAALELKQSQSARVRPNQVHYVNQLNWMSYASFIYPENMEKVFNELQSTFRP